MAISMPGMPGQRFRGKFRGYNVQDVDAFFALIEARAVNAEQIDEAVFRLSWKGYDPREVDDALDRAKASLPPEKGRGRDGR
jgi:DivIVA domain-containing protein